MGVKLEGGSIFGFHRNLHEWFHKGFRGGLHECFHKGFRGGLLVTFPRAHVSLFRMNENNQPRIQSGMEITSIFFRTLAVASRIFF